MFAEDSQLMTVYEPLWITKKWNKEDISQIPNWTKNVLDLLRGILSCKFSETAAGVKFLSHTSRQWSGAYVKNPFRSQNFCPNWECRDLASNPTYADIVCLTKYKHSVTKIGEPRTPNGLISSFLPKLFLENPDTDIRVIQLIRDPTGSLRSRIKLKWMVDWKHSSFPNVVRKICSNLATNIKFGRNLGKWQDKYLEVHYHDLAGKPLETTRAMYEFAEFIMPDSVADWVVRNTSPTKEELMKEKNNIFSPVRNSTANIEKWRQDSPVERIRIIEKYCQEALDLLGLKKML
ncbi:carbohydrate sulfotransferase 3-like [Stylophora pistillata]|uniref:carbohydrate sulfotransferase 3-like n=1 Tax=Stylophora pistillata TaxID=50429 RepID=UPI000C04235E|nr:carbohydrate sulfotransferase 3-like [Stylophora pistillata]